MSGDGGENGWGGFPEVPGWAPFRPAIEAAAHPRVFNVPTQERAESLRACNLKEALEHLFTQSWVPVVYRVLPSDTSACHYPPEQNRYELRWPLLKPGASGPRKIMRLESSILWSEQSKCLAYFGLLRERDRKSLHLVVQGRSPKHCRATWMAVCDWIRECLRERFPDLWIPKKLTFPGTKAKRPKKPSAVQERNNAIRNALREAARLEGKKRRFQLSGRGHEPRITLDPSFAAIVRSIRLPRIHISGYGANYYYPVRVLMRAAEQLQELYGRRMIGFGVTRAYVEY